MYLSMGWEGEEREGVGWGIDEMNLRGRCDYDQEQGMANGIQHSGKGEMNLGRLDLDPTFSNWLSSKMPSISSLLYIKHPQIYLSL